MSELDNNPLFKRKKKYYNSARGMNDIVHGFVRREIEDDRILHSSPFASPYAKVRFVRDVPHLEIGFKGEF